MSSSRFQLRLLLIALFLALPALQPLSAKNSSDWNAKTHNGRAYVPLSKVKDFYGFTSMKKVGRKIVLKNKQFNLEFQAGGQEVMMNGVKFIFSYPVTALGTYHISVLDLKKVINPVLKPTMVKGKKAFDTIVIDPGHGGRDAGAVNSLGTEAGYNLKVARLLRDNLKKRGFKVVMTRDSDVYLTLGQRVRLANKYKNAIFISIHFNAAGRNGRASARGIETFTLSPKGVPHYGRSFKASDMINRPGNAQDSANIALATTIHWASLKLLNHKTAAGNRIPDRGVRRARYSVLTSVNHPAVLFEGGFMSHPKEKYLINSPDYQRTLAKAICDAICIYRKATLGQTAKKSSARR